MRQYLDLLRQVMRGGYVAEDRSGNRTGSIFGHQMRFNLQEGFPLLTTKKVHLKSIIHELLWFISGNTNVRYLQENGVRIWNEWAREDGSLGPVYGAQWRSWPAYGGGSIDQLSNVIDQIKTNPHSRRLVVSAWNVAQLSEMQLPPCHLLFQFYVGNDQRLSLQVYQRSADVFLGLPFNIASYSLLLMMVAQVTGLVPYELIHTAGSVHIYLSHTGQAWQQLQRQPRPLPTMRLNPDVKTIDGFNFEDFTLENYDPWPALPAKVVV